MQDLGENMGYVSEPCPKCGRVRVEKYVIAVNTGQAVKHICEKCAWCIEDREYFDWDKYLEETEDDFWGEIDGILAGWRK